MKKTVQNFLPSQNGFHFPNSFADMPYEFKLLGINVKGGHALNGMCGGMIYATCDLFYAGRLAPEQQVAPDKGSLFVYLCQRLIESFALPFGPLRYYFWMNPRVADSDEDLPKFSLVTHGRAWKTIAVEWPEIRREIDANHLCPIGIILLKSWNPDNLGRNHQVLVYGYELEGDDLKLLLYDPNSPGDDGVYLALNVADPRKRVAITYANSLGKVGEVLCFFKTRYKIKVPSIHPASV
jgi:hypothetical protein